jgi:L-fuconolactonase
MRIDAHQHFWNLSDRIGSWPPASLTAIYRDFAPSDLQGALAECEIQGTVLVQSLPSIEDTRFLLNIAQHHAFVLGVVGWVDLLSADAPTYIANLALNPKFKGIRPMLQDLSDTEWICSEALSPAIEAMQAHGLVFDALVLPQHLRALHAFALRHPDLPIVIDHAAKPEIAKGQFQPWLQDLSALAALPQVHCKLSGLLTEAGSLPNLQTIAPYVEHVLTLFGPRRLIWGSDWPVVLLVSDYAEWFAMAQQLCKLHDGLNQPDIDAIFGTNAKNFYKL